MKQKTESEINRTKHHKLVLEAIGILWEKYPELKFSELLDHLNLTPKDSDEQLASKLEHRCIYGV